MFPVITNRKAYVFRRNTGFFPDSGARLPFLLQRNVSGRTLRDLATDLTRLGHTVWLDEWEIRVGDPILEKVSVGIDQADFVAVVLSKAAVASKWVEAEWQPKYWDEIAQRRIRVLPILREDCLIPTLLRAKRHADFRTFYKSGLVDLASALSTRLEDSGCLAAYSDFVDIPEVWNRLFNLADRLDLLITYGATWRHTYLKSIQSILDQRRALIRVVLPDPRQSNVALPLLAKRQGIASAELQKRIRTAITEFKDLDNGRGQIEIYSTTRYLTHACYLFGNTGVLALFSYRENRVPTPAFELVSGTLLNFLQRDFDWLISDQNGDRHIFYKLSPKTNP